MQALTGVDLDVPAGQVTALAGDNGAGKSVLIKCIAGIHTPDAGQILWEGQPVHIRTPREAAALGIETVHQDLALCDNLDIVQNMFLGRERVHHLALAEEDMEKAAGDTLARLAVTTVRSIRQPVASLSGGQRQSVAIAKAVLWNSKLVIMDEPTAALGVAQTTMVLELVRRLADRGLAVLIVSHNMNDVFEVADRIAVLYLGRLVAVRPVAELDRQIVVDLMTTGSLDPMTDWATRRRRADPRPRQPRPTWPWPRSSCPHRCPSTCASASAGCAAGRAACCRSSAGSSSSRSCSSRSTPTSSRPATWSTS